MGINWVDQGLPSTLHWSIGALPGKLPHWGPSPPSQWGSLIWQEGEGGCSPTSTSNSGSVPNGPLPNRLSASLSHPLVSCNCNLPPTPHLFMSHARTVSHRPFNLEPVEILSRRCVGWVEQGHLCTYFVTKSMTCHKNRNTSEEPSIHRMINADMLFCVTCSVTCDV